MDIGEHSSICFAQAFAAEMRFSGSTTSFTKPSRIPSSAETCLPVNIIPRAFFIPICLGSLCIPPARAARPTLGSGKANFALVEATIKSQASAISNPPPMETPFTAAIRGLVKLNLEVNPAKPEEAILISIFPPASAWNLRSFPAEKARSPSPVTIPTQRFSSLSNSFQTSSNSACAGGCKAFILSGLFMVTVKM